MGKAAALREEAIADFKAADALVAGDEGPKPEDQERFDTLFASGQEKMKAFQAQSEREGRIVSVREALGDIAGAVRGGNPIPFSGRTILADPNRGKSWGQIFVGSDAYAELKASGVLQSPSASFKTNPIMAVANTDVIQSTPGTGPGSALVAPQFLPGIIPLEARPLTVRALFSQGTTTSDSISYAQQATRTGSAATVSQATTVSNGAKPQASIGWERKTSVVETIAVWMAATRQQLADAGQVQALIDNQLRLLLALEEENQLLNGNGTSPNLSGIYDQAIQTSTAPGTSDGDPNLDAVRNAKRLVRVGASRLSADALVLNPTDSMQFDLLVDGEGRYRVGDPYGPVNPNPSPIWGLRRVESEAIDEGHALIGAFNAGATVLERQGVTILTADQHADFFIRNLIVILAEERLGFPVYFPSAFVDLTLDGWANSFS